MPEWLKVVEGVRAKSPGGAALLMSCEAEYLPDRIVLTFHESEPYRRLTQNQRGLQLVESVARKEQGLGLSVRYAIAPKFDPTAPTWAMIGRASETELKPLWRAQQCPCGQDLDMVVPVGPLLLWRCADCGNLLLDGTVGQRYRSRWFGNCTVEEVREL